MLDNLYCAAKHASTYSDPLFSTLVSFLNKVMFLHLQHDAGTYLLVQVLTVVGTELLPRCSPSDVDSDDLFLFQLGYYTSFDHAFVVFSNHTHFKARVKGGRRKAKPFWFLTMAFQCSRYKRCDVLSRAHRV